MRLIPVREIGIEPSHVPEGLLRIARRFNAGSKPQTDRVPTGRLEAFVCPIRTRTHATASQPSLRDVSPTAWNPALKRRASVRRSLRDDGSAESGLLISAEIWCPEFRSDPGISPLKQRMLGVYPQ